MTGEEFNQEKEIDRVIEQIDYKDILNLKFIPLVKQHLENVRLMAQDTRLTNLK